MDVECFGEIELGELDPLPPAPAREFGGIRLVPRPVATAPEHGGGGGAGAIDRIAGLDQSNPEMDALFSNYFGTLAAQGPTAAGRLLRGGKGNKKKKKKSPTLKRPLEAVDAGDSFGGPVLRPAKRPRPQPAAGDSDAGGAGLSNTSLDSLNVSVAADPLPRYIQLTEADHRNEEKTRLWVRQALERERRHRQRCYLCSRGHRVVDNTGLGVRLHGDLLRIIESRYITMQQIPLTLMVEDYFHNRVAPFFERQSVPPPTFDAVEIWMHLSTLRHTRNSVVAQTTGLDILTMMRDQLATEVVREGHGSDVNKMRELRQQILSITELHKLDPSRLVFGAPAADDLHPDVAAYMSAAQATDHERPSLMPSTVAWMDDYLVRTGTEPPPPAAPPGAGVEEMAVPPFQEEPLSSISSEDGDPNELS